jgi:hypothetical protein
MVTPLLYVTHVSAKTAVEIIVKNNKVVTFFMFAPWLIKFF